ncbi:MAG: hypothetical protein A2X32_03250 [Elusimicrobia bacterium GWC2_64_44]|nr:MAG: hypothetical protein A2X32_03250 [Elusimicrobia bacterium GWC2_64_44]
MKILLTAAIVLTVAAAACAFDLGGFFSGCAKPAAVPAAPAPSAGTETADSAFPANLKPEEALRFIESVKPVVIDIRTAEEHAAGYIQPTHEVMDYYAPDFKERLAKLDRNGKYLLYCRSGRRTGAALQVMGDLGFAGAHDIAGGITAWTSAGLPVAK